MSRVLYKRIPPPPEPEDEPYPRLPTSPSYECPEDEAMMADYIPDERDPNTHFPDDDDHNIPRYGIHPDYDASYDDHNTYSKEDHERQTKKCVTAVLDHYNSQEENKIKYNLTKAITSTGILDGWRYYGHVNFTAKSSLENSKEEFFFAEICSDHGHDTYIPTCIVSLGEKERIGGVRGIKGIDGYYGMEIRVDTRHCYACEEEIMHPEDGTLYEIGHHVDSCYGYD
ncbi:unnamed protein product [Alopecurus aequalis]